MRTQSIVFALIFAFVGTAHTETTGNTLDHLGWLIGTWTAHTATANGDPSITEVKYEWASERKAIRYSIVRKSGTEVVPTMQGLCGWHPGRKQIVLWEIDKEGSLTESSLTVRGGTLHLDEMIHGADGTALRVRSEIVRKSDDAFSFKASVQKQGRWSVVFATMYTRVKG